MASDDNRFNTLGHVLMGLANGFLPLNLLWTRREINQLPPENDANPVKWHQINGRWKQYWSEERVRDTLDDLHEVAFGQTVGWFMTLGMGLAVGRWLL